MYGSAYFTSTLSIFFSLFFVHSTHLAKVIGYFCRICTTIATERAVSSRTSHIHICLPNRHLITTESLVRFFPYSIQPFSIFFPPL